MDRLFHNIPCLKKIYGILPGSGKWRAHLPVSWRDTTLRWHQVDHLFRVLKRPFYASSLQREGQNFILYYPIISMEPAWRVQTKHELSWRPAPRNRSGHLRFKRGPEADQTDVNTDELLRVFEEDSDVTGSAFFDEDDLGGTGSLSGSLVCGYLVRSGDAEDSSFTMV
ncbi:uncharacterized protein PADG_03974 [Paracoccidioides brasiliensis Pb18]|uniref:Uncharacterized protein n=1 Tax=Paracoccidioides brasiliensis (strain Pb18) TaxID=502780 RepID=C1G9N8_PARBD|nr:uncharacterized protein PADG_03974 [Paracoccidioides brasiliensis Pb18]EEH47890.2 hypothetical protein PADG_03974 [Paracoccidioides brasiliensis Pb18]